MHTQKSIWCLLMMLLCLLSLTALAQQAQDITAECIINASANPKGIRKLLDRNAGTAWSSPKAQTVEIDLSLRDETPAGGLYIIWGEMPDVWTLEAAGEEWETLHSDGRDGFAHVYMPLQGQNRLRLRMESNSKKTISIQEMYVFSQGETPPWVQKWEPTVEKADLLVLSAHPDDEHLFMGGTLPLYAGQKQMQVLVAYMTCASVNRRSELLNGLWEVGVRNYPVIGAFKDKRYDTAKEMYRLWGKEKTQRFVVDLYRKYKPLVVISHDVRGEYGHGAHMVCAALSRYALEAAADPDQYPESAQEYGLWDVPKLYLHLYKENQITMDWRQPLEAFGGRTALDMAVLGFAQHTSQQVYQLKVKDSGSYSCAEFGLVRSLVGPDVCRSDFFENITGKDFD